MVFNREMPKCRDGVLSIMSDIEWTEPGLRVAFLEMLYDDFDIRGDILGALIACFVSVDIVYWAIGGLSNFGTAFALGAISGDVSLRIIAYVLLVPMFVLTKFLYHMIFDRDSMMSGSCPSNSVFDLDWFAVGVLGTSFPMALQDAGAWIFSTVIYLISLFVLPRLVDDRRTGNILKVGGLAVGFGLYLFIVHGDPSALPDFMTFTLSDQTTQQIVDLVTSIVFGPFLLGLFAVGNAVVLTSRPFKTIPYAGPLLPDRDNIRSVFVSGAIGTVMFLGIQGVLTGDLIIFP